MVIEKIPPTGFLADENAELKSMGYWSSEDIYRLSFFTRKIRTWLGLVFVQNDAFQGYAILKCDGKSKSSARWYVYEAVFRKYNHPHNFVSRPATYSVKVGPRMFRIKGILYCQQNGLNKSCAHVAIQSLLSRLGKDMSYSEMNQIAEAVVVTKKFIPGKGLEDCQIVAILESRGLNVKPLNYEQLEKTSKGSTNPREAFPYQKILYQGIESGMGVLLGFRLDNPLYKNARHMIPFYGHTFNKDTWITDAEAAYFKISDAVGYIPSDKWTSSFIGHDDNFGPNFCMPRLYLDAGKVDYIAEVLLDDVQYTGMEAEAAAFPLLKWFIPYLGERNFWQKRLKQAFSASIPRVVLRAVCVDSDSYFNHLQRCVDWEGKKERPSLVEAARKSGWASKFWVVEVSLPQLFAAHERKLGEIVLDATISIDPSKSIAGTSVFLFARFPSIYLIADGDRLGLDSFESGLESHVPLISLAEA